MNNTQEEQQNIYCCETMKSQMNVICDIHKDHFDCPDNIIYKSKSDEFGIIIHDGGESFIVISYCPWCGKKLVPDKN